jgi:hypothetical protein
VKTTAAKALTAAVGGTLTAITTALATVQLVLADDAVDLAEYGTLATAIATLVATVAAVWRVPNRPVG